MTLPTREQAEDLLVEVGKSLEKVKKPPNLSATLVTAMRLADAYIKGELVRKPEQKEFKTLLKKHGVRTIHKREEIYQAILKLLDGGE